jgi:hypothetical protein
LQKLTQNVNLHKIPIVDLHFELIFAIFNRILIDLQVFYVDLHFELIFTIFNKVLIDL